MTSDPDEVDAADDSVGARAASDPKPDEDVTQRAEEILADESQRNEERELAESLGVDLEDPDLETEINRLAVDADVERPFGALGRPLPQDSALRLGFLGALGVSLALLLVRLLTVTAPILLLIAIALFFAIGLDPVVTWLQHRGMRRGFAVLATVSVVVLFFGGFLAVAVPPLVSQGTELVGDLPAYIERVERQNNFAKQLNQRFGITDKLQEFAGGSGGGVPEPDTDEVVGVAKVAFTALASLLTVLVLSLYFLAAFPRMKRTAYRLVPRSRRARFSLLSDEILAQVGAYLLGNIATSFIAGLVAFVFFRLFGVPYPLPLAMLVAVMDMIPLVGATVAAVISSAVAFSVSVPVGISSVVYFTLYQQFENFFLIPRVMKRVVDVSPIATIVAVLVGASLLGIFGAVLAVPVAASIQMIGRQVLLPRQEAA